MDWLTAQARRFGPAAKLDATGLSVAKRIALVPTELSQINKRVVHLAMEIMGLRGAIRSGTELQALAFLQPGLPRAQYKRDGRSVRDLLSQRNARPSRTIEHVTRTKRLRPMRVAGASCPRRGASAAP